MISLSDNEFSVISFLVRNFAEKLTIRNMAQRLGFSAAGVFNILKKLEKENIVTGQKLGTGLFYAINLENSIARHLACVVLLHSEDKINIDAAMFKHAKAAIFDKKNLLLVTDSITPIEISIPNVNVIVKTEDEAVSLLRKKDSEMLAILKKGVVLLGEDKFAEIIKNCISGF